MLDEPAFAGGQASRRAAATRRAPAGGPRKRGIGPWFPGWHGSGELASLAALVPREAACSTSTSILTAATKTSAMPMPRLAQACIVGRKARHDGGAAFDEPRRADREDQHADDVEQRPAPEGGVRRGRGERSTDMMGTKGRKWLT